MELAPGETFTADLAVSIDPGVEVPRAPRCRVDQPREPAPASAPPPIMPTPGPEPEARPEWPTTVGVRVERSGFSQDEYGSVGYGIVLSNPSVEDAVDVEVAVNVVDASGLILDADVNEITVIPAGATSFAHVGIVSLDSSGAVVSGASTYLDGDLPPGRSAVFDSYLTGARAGAEVTEVRASVEGAVN